MPVREMTELIKAQRGYEMNAKVITAADQMLRRHDAGALMRASGSPDAFCRWPALADTVVAARTIRAQAVIGPTDLSTWSETDQSGRLSDPAEAIGQEARVMLYAGRPILPGDLGPPALVDRNQLVSLAYQSWRADHSGRRPRAGARRRGRRDPGDEHWPRTAR